MTVTNFLPSIVLRAAIIAFFWCLSAVRLCTLFYGWLQALAPGWCRQKGDNRPVAVTVELGDSPSIVTRLFRGRTEFCVCEIRKTWLCRVTSVFNEVNPPPRASPPPPPISAKCPSVSEQTYLPYIIHGKVECLCERVCMLVWVSKCVCVCVCVCVCALLEERARGTGWHSCQGLNSTASACPSHIFWAAEHFTTKRSWYFVIARWKRHIMRHVKR